MTTTELAAARAGRERRYRLGVMGGTFDPIHHGHLVAASEVAARFDLDEVVFVPTGMPWQKADRQVSHAEDRYLMTVIAMSSNPRFSVSRVDIDRPGNTYTVDTLKDLRAERGEDVDLFFITGADAVRQILTWHGADELFDLAHFVGVTRPGVPMTEDDLAHLPEGAVTLLEVPRPGHLLHGLSRPGATLRTDLVPGTGRYRPVHCQTRVVPASRDRSSR